MLHIIETQLSRAAFNRLIQTLGNKDAIVLLNDGVYLANHWSSNEHQGYIMAEDAIVRGINPHQSTHKLQPIAMLDLVNLTAKHSNSATW